MRDSALGQRWEKRGQDSEAVAAIMLETGAPNIVAQLLAGRGVAAKDAAGFLSPTLREFLPDPSTFKDMDKAAGLILDAIEAGHAITVFADYDVDGGTSAAQLIRWGRALGHEIGLYVPDRVAEGYGPSIDAFEQLKEEGAQLVITVDCGAAAREALERAAAIDLPVIVVDHHMMEGDMPPALALINPNRPDDTSGMGHMAAAGVTFILLVALSREARRRGRTDVPDIRRFLDLTAMGTICDVVPLTGINRAFVRQGLKVLGQRQNLGLVALAEVAGASGEPSTYHAGFLVGPRINAGGRIGRADMGAQMLSSDDPLVVQEAAQMLDQVNKDRKILQADMMTEALSKAANLPSGQAVTIVSMDGWHPGVIGIVAGRLKDRFNRPAIVIGVNDEGIGKGSGRSIKGANLGGAIVAAKQAGLLTSGGGHAMAGGLSMDARNIGALTCFINEHMEAEVTAARKLACLKIDVVLTTNAANEALINAIADVGPFGAGNPQPMFAFENLRIAYAERVRGGHVRCSFEDAAGGRINGIAFRADESGIADILLSPKQPFVHVAGRIKRDEWKGRVKIDLNVVDIAIASQE